MTTIPPRRTSTIPPAEKLQNLSLEEMYESAENNLAAASYRLALLLNAANGYTKPTPTSSEIIAAARRFSIGIGVTMWERKSIIAECRALGLEVLD